MPPVGIEVEQQRDGGPVLRRTFAAIAVPNYRRYFVGQAVSMGGTWVQNVAAVWLIVELTGSAVAVGVTSALQFLPLMLFGAWGGVLADSVDKRRLLIVSQLALMTPSIVLAIATFTGTVTPLLVYAMLFLGGAAKAVDNPARQALPIELVGPERLVNAVALNSVIFHGARILGPAVAGVLIAFAGIAWCFAVDALTFLVMIVALARLDESRMRPPARADRHERPIRAGLAYVRRSPQLLIPLAMMGAIGLLTFNFQVVLPLLASETWNGTATTFMLLTVAMGTGSIAGALFIGGRRSIGPRLVVGSAVTFGAFQLLAAVAPRLPLQVAALVALGTASVAFSASVSSTLQLEVEPGMRGRVMALYTLVFLGSTPIGAPLVGWVAEVTGPRVGMGLGGVAALASALAAALAYRRVGRAPAPA